MAGAAVLALTLSAGVAAHADTASDAAATSAGAQVGEIIVTAQRREENLQNVPVSVTAVSGQQLRNAAFTSLTDIQHLASSVQFTSGVSPEYEIRGVGTQTFDYGIEQSVGIFIDDVVWALPRSPDLGTLADVSQIQVLDGPQGTLFGKNTSAGAIVVTTNRPQIGAFSNDAHISYGSRNEMIFDDTLNVPVNDTFALRFTAGYNHRDGFVKNLFTGRELYAQDNGTFRAKALWRPNSNLEVLLSGDFETHRDNSSSVWTIRSFGTGTGAIYVPPNFIQQQLTSYGVVPGPDNVEGAWNGPIYTKDWTYGGQAQVNYHFPSGITLTSVTADYHYEYRVALEVDSTPLPVFDTNNGFIHSNQFTQELRLTSPSKGPVEWVGGLYFFDLVNDPGQLQGGTFGLLPNNTTTFLSSQAGAPRYHVDSRSYAAFGQGSWHVTPQLSLILGARYTYDDLLSQYGVVPAANFCQITYAFGAPCGQANFQNPPVNPKHGDWSGRAGLQYQFTPDLMAYATIARGYKGPTVNNILGGGTVVEPETSVDYEGGVKSEFLDHRLQANLAVFYEDFHNFQAQVFDTRVSPPTYEEGNAGGLLSKGFQGMLTAQVTHDLSVSANVMYADTYFTDYVTQCDPGIVCGMFNPATGGYQVRGAALTNSPKWSYNLAANYSHDVTDNLVLDAHATWSWKSKVFFAVNDPNTIQPGYGIFNANVGVGPRDGAWRMGLFARNLFDQHYVVGIIPTFFDTGGYANFPDPSGNSFRTVGVSLDVRVR